MANLPNIDPQNIPESWRKVAPPQSGGSPVRVYRGFARRVNHHSQQAINRCPRRIITPQSTYDFRV